MVCSSCGTQNPAATKFCKECGSRLGLACSNCGIGLMPDAKFCGECGTPTPSPVGPAAARAAAGPGAPSQAASHVAERRLVSILFADLVGFTTLSEGRDAEDTRELLTRYFDLSRDVIARYGGTVEKFIGDAVMAVWGAPVAREDDAERAVRAALDLVDAVRSLGPAIQARAGVLTGEAAVTLGATNQGMVAGDLVNTASRLQSVAAPGTVLVGEATVARRRSRRSRSSPPASRASRARPRRSPPGGRCASSRRSAVGDRVGHARGAVRRPRRRAAACSRTCSTRRPARSEPAWSRVIGPAGIGKTRLAWEFTKYTRRPDRARCGGTTAALRPTARGSASGRSARWSASALRPARDRRRARRPGRRSPRRWPPMSRMPTSAVGSNRRCSPCWASRSACGREQLFGAWRTFFERLAATAPGGHGVRGPPLRRRGSARLRRPPAGVEPERPDLRGDPVPPRAAREAPDLGRRQAQLHVRCTSSRSPSPRCASSWPGSCPACRSAAVRAIVARADGIPLYAVETVRMLLADGRLALDDGVYHPVGDLASPRRPGDAHRADRVPPRRPGLPTTAPSSRMRRFSARASRSRGCPRCRAIEPDILEPRLRALVRRELLTLEADPA